MNFSNLRRSEWIAAAGGAVLVLSLFVTWYHLQKAGVHRDTNSDDAWACGIGHYSCSGFNTFPIMRWLLIAAAAAPLILGYLVASHTDVSYPRGEFTAIVGMTAVVLIAYNGFIDKPSASDIGIHFSIGYFIGLLAAIAIFVGGASSSLEDGGGAPRKPPATF